MPGRAQPPCNAAPARIVVAPKPSRKVRLMPLPTILLLIALVCFLAAAFGFAVRRLNLTALGLAFAVASVLAGSELIG